MCPTRDETSNPSVGSNKKIGRNSPCPCGSGKKYKRCCLANSECLIQQVGKPSISRNNLQTKSIPTVRLIVDTGHEVLLQYLSSAEVKLIESEIRKIRYLPSLGIEFFSETLTITFCDDFFYGLTILDNLRTGQTEWKMEKGHNRSDEMILNFAILSLWFYFGSSNSTTTWKMLRHREQILDTRSELKEAIATFDYEEKLLRDTVLEAVYVKTPFRVANSFKRWGESLGLSEKPDFVHLNLQNFNSSESRHMVPQNAPSAFRSVDISYGYCADSKAAGSILYQFSNGVIVGCNEIFFHPLKSKVRDSLLPRVVLAGAGRLPPYQIYREHNINRWYFGEADQDSTELSNSLIQVLEDALTEKLPVFLVSPGTQSDSIEPFGIRVKKIEKDLPREPLFRGFTPHESGQVELSIALDSSQLKSLHSSENLFYEHFRFDLKEKTLRFHLLGRQWDFIRRESYRLDHADGNSRFQYGAKKALKNGALNFSIRGHRQISDFFFRASERGIFPPMEIPTDVIDDLKASVSLEERSWLGINLSSESVHEELKIAPHDAISFLRFMIEGLSYGLGTRIRDRVKRIRDIGTRERAVKFLRHQGVGVVFFLEVVDQLENQRPDREFEEKLQKALTQLLRGIFNQSSLSVVSLPDLISKKLSQEVVSLARSWVGVLSCPVTTYREKKIDWKQANLWILRLFEGFVITMLDAEPASLVKHRVLRRTKFLNHFFDRHSILEREEAGKCLSLHPLDFSELKIDRQHLVSVLGSKGFAISINGAPLTVLDPDKLSAQIEISEKDWFELHPKVFLGGKEVDSKQIFSSSGWIEHGGRYYLVDKKKLPHINYLSAFWERLQSGRVKQKYKTIDGDFSPLPRSLTLTLLAMRQAGIPTVGFPNWAKICETFDALGNSEHSLSNSGFIGDLKPFQKSGVDWLLDLHDLCLGGILADEMGLGKTVQTLCYLSILHSKGGLGQAILFCPTSIAWNWASEAKRFSPNLIVEPYSRQGNPEADVVICTYGILGRYGEEFAETNFDIAIFDEAQNLKNISAKRTVAARKIPAKIKFCLTGTPFENHCGELFSLIDLVAPGALGEWRDFNEDFVRNTPSPQDLGLLRLKIRPLVLRRTKDRVSLELPPVSESVVPLEFEKEQKQIYRDIALSWNDKVEQNILKNGEKGTKLMMLTALLRLRQVCTDPKMLPDTKYTKVSPKIETVVEALEEVYRSGHSSLVFTQFISTIDAIKSALLEKSIAVFAITGKTSGKRRKAILSGFQMSTSPEVLLMTLKTGGVGLNLTKASYVFHVEPWWNPAVENQATDRAHRIGQKKSVQVYRYIIRDSVEEKIEALKTEKMNRFLSVFEDNQVELSQAEQQFKLSKKDFDYIIH